MGYGQLIGGCTRILEHNETVLKDREAVAWVWLSVTTYKALLFYGESLHMLIENIVVQVKGLFLLYRGWWWVCMYYPVVY